MALDHYISQVYLRNFYASELGNRMYAFRKKDLKIFTPPSDDVCRIKDHSTNPYLEDPRAIEEFLKGIEPKLNQSISELTEGKVTHSTVYVIAGFVSFISVCSPTSMRIHSEPMQQHLGEVARNLDKYEQIPKPPPELEADSLTQLLDEGKISFDIDQKFPQAMGISSILKFTSLFGNSIWEILHNRIEDSPFFTSDYPITLEWKSHLGPALLVIPLTPTLGIRIYPQRPANQDEIDLNFSNFGFRIVRPKRKQIMNINRNIVRCSESLVFSSIMSPWIPKFIEKNKNYQIKSITSRLPAGKEAYFISRKQIVNNS